MDDDEKLNGLLTSYLSQFGFKVDAVSHPRDCLRRLDPEPPDLIILDIMLPDMDGFELCREIRKQHSVPIIMLTARGEVADKIVGLELGADDYLAKPFEPRELLARIRSVLRRGPGDLQPGVVRFGELVIDFGRRSTTLDGDTIELTAMEFEILSVFARSPGRVLRREEILESLRGLEWTPWNRSVDVLIGRLRRKLGDDPRKPSLLKTVRGTGYMFMGDRTDDDT